MSRERTHGTQKSRRRIFPLVVILIIAAAAAGIWGEDITKSIGQKGGREYSNQPMMMPTITVEKTTITKSISATGNIQPIRSVDLRFNAGGKVQELFVEKGSRVKKDQVLATLDNRQQELAYMRARNAYEIALFDAAPTAIKERELDIEVALENLEKTKLKAPFNGVIVDMNLEVGQSVDLTNVVMRIVDDSSYQVVVLVDELDIAQVKVGQKAILSLDAEADRVYEGTVEEVGLLANIQGGVVTVPVTVRFNKVDPSLRSGYTATANIIVTERTDILAVPVEALNSSGGATTVTKMVDGKEVIVSVETGMTDGRWVEILSGLEEGDEIVALNYRGGFPGFNGPTGGPGNRNLNMNVLGGMGMPRVQIRR